jgi:hypothetical protein
VIEKAQKLLLPERYRDWGKNLGEKMAKKLALEVKKETPAANTAKKRKSGQISLLSSKKLTLRNGLSLLY